MFVGFDLSWLVILSWKLVTVFCLLGPFPLLVSSGTHPPTLPMHVPVLVPEADIGFRSDQRTTFL